MTQKIDSAGGRRHNKRFCTMKMKLRNALYAVALILLLFPAAVAAQDQTEDVIYFRNGDILRGEIIEQMEKGTLRIRTACRNVFVVFPDEVEEIRRENLPEKRYYKRSGYLNRSGLDLLPGGSGTAVRFQMVNGYRFSSRLSAGIGVGFIMYDDPQNLLPLFAELKFRFFEANSTPFAYLRSGYGFSVWSDENMEAESHRGGFMLNPGVGLQFDTVDRFGFYFTAGYNLDNSSFEQEMNGRILVEDIAYRRLLFGFGLTF